MPVALAEVEADPAVRAYLTAADEAFARIGYKEHGYRHAKLTASIAGNVLRYLGHPERDQELARIAGFLHDIGNAVNRDAHAQAGGVMAMRMLSRLGMPAPEVHLVAEAVAGHEEKELEPNHPITAAVILGDKTDVHRSRVRKDPKSPGFDSHDRVNYACQRSFLRVDGEKRVVALELTLDTALIDPMEYFEIFLERCLHSRLAARRLGCSLEVYINRARFY